MNETISTRTLHTLAMDDIYQSGLVQQCRKLEADFGTNILAKYLDDPESAKQIVALEKKFILARDLELKQVNTLHCNSLWISHG